MASRLKQEMLFSFIHVPDLHLSLPDNPCNPGPIDALTPLIESLREERDHPLPDFAVIGGDNIHGFQKDGGVICAAETRLLREQMDRFPCRFHILCHGHDTWGEAHAGAWFRKFFADGNADFPNAQSEWPGNFQVLCMSGCFENADGGAGSLEYDWFDFDWLDRQLTRAKGKRVLLFTHMPPYPPRGEARDESGKMRPWQARVARHTGEQSERILALVEHHGNVVVHYSGHCHVNSILRRGKTVYCTTASLSSEPWEYRYVEVWPDRIVNKCIAPRQEKVRPGFWAGCTDEDHPTVEIYHGGLPEERDFLVEI